MICCNLVIEKRNTNLLTISSNAEDEFLRFRIYCELRILQKNPNILHPKNMFFATLKCFARCLSYSGDYLY